ncbi:lipoprotein [Yersinia ruckeri]|uniref:Putative lipoprotein n=2 Tax=Gammaproteobacteria TaxID=1236 RepID=A0A085U9S3_YERRU|nr:lipoprotein [Yersinia ruckeri]AKA39799.1 lipoprotein [Yersinia ruckeri]ARZ01500.1 lipoprotein [Yersinia ruckeri]EEQ00777.1 hypothetical protein yruck0001_19980 [Yersinia ruckeri ATCC 29473]EKN3345173.1 lipoprotein [Yersinia ruckeri]EKN3360592.1 lipoprotein [Yersinia ruckeri]
MKNKNILLALPLALLLSACTTSVTPAFKDIGSRSSPCIDGGPDQVAAQFYSLRIQQLGGVNSSESLRPFLSQALYQDIQTARQQQSRSQATPQAAATEKEVIDNLYKNFSDADVASASTIPNSDAKHIPLRVNLVHKTPEGHEYRWQDEVLMVREGTCWVVDDIRFIDSRATSSSLRQLLSQH